MKGLILKDLYSLRGYAKQYVLVLGFMAVWAVMMNNYSFFMMYTTLLGSMMVLSTLTFDETASFNRFALTTPISIKKLIGEKYILLLIMTGAGSIISLGMNLALPIIIGREGAMEWGALIIYFTVFMVISSFCFPAVFKLGVEKGRYVYYMMMMGIMVIIFGGVKILGRAGISQGGNIPKGIEKIPLSLLGVYAVCFSLALLAVSYMLSIRLVKKKEW